MRGEDEEGRSNFRCQSDFPSSPHRFSLIFFSWRLGCLLILDHFSQICQAFYYFFCTDALLPSGNIKKKESRFVKRKKKDTLCWTWDKKCLTQLPPFFFFFLKKTDLPKCQRKWLSCICLNVDKHAGWQLWQTGQEKGSLSFIILERIQFLLTHIASFFFPCQFLPVFQKQFSSVLHSDWMHRFHFTFESNFFFSSFKILRLYFTCVRETKRKKENFPQVRGGGAEGNGIVASIMRNKKEERKKKKITFRFLGKFLSRQGDKNGNFLHKNRGERGGGRGREGGEGKVEEEKQFFWRDRTRRFHKHWKKNEAITVTKKVGGFFFKTDSFLIATPGFAKDIFFCPDRSSALTWLSFFLLLLPRYIK